MKTQFDKSDIHAAGGSKTLETLFFPPPEFEYKMSENSAI